MLGRRTRPKLKISTLPRTATLPGSIGADFGFPTGRLRSASVAFMCVSKSYEQIRRKYGRRLIEGLRVSRVVLRRATWGSPDVPAGRLDEACRPHPRVPAVKPPRTRCCLRRCSRGRHCLSSSGAGAGAAVTAVLSGHQVPEVDLGTGVTTIAGHRGNPSAAWGERSVPRGCTGPRRRRDLEIAIALSDLALDGHAATRSASLRYSRAWAHCSPRVRLNLSTLPLVRWLVGAGSFVGDRAKGFAEKL